MTTIKFNIQDFKDVELEFTHYYKYTFFFSGEKNGYKFIGSLGGEAEAIYRRRITWNHIIKVGDYERVLNTLEVQDNENNIVFNYEDY